MAEGNMIKPNGEDIIIQPDLATIFEFCCTANSGRSPLAELIAEQYLRKIGVDQEYSVISSGTSVDAIAERQASEAHVPYLLNVALERDDIDLYTPEEAERIMKSMETGDKEFLHKMYWMACDLFKSEEVAWREEMPELFGIEGEIKRTHDQTVARPDTIAVFGMAESNKKAIERIYEGRTYQPIIKSLDALDAFGYQREEYVKCVEGLTMKVPQAIDTILNNAS